MKIQVCIVSAQAAANLLPALDPQLKPERVVLVTSAAMRDGAEHLGKVLREVGIQPETLAISNEHDHDAMQFSLLEWADKNGDSGHEFTLNLTGGTKLMALAANSVAREYGWKVFYVDADTGLVIWLHDKAPGPQALTQQLRLRHYLASYGFSLTQPTQKPQPNADLKTLTDTLIKEIGSLEAAIGQLNWIAQQAQVRGVLRWKMELQHLDSLSLAALLRHFSTAGVLRVEGDAICFADQDNLSFANGGWLELHVFRVLSESARGLEIREQAANLNVANPQGVKNEMDIAFLARNRLYVIECKTQRMDRPDSLKANDTLYKIAENCRRIGGSGTRGMLVSYRNLNDHEKRLAAALNIELVCGRDIQRLPEKLKHWVH